MSNHYVHAYYRFLQDLQLAQNYHAPYQLESTGGIARNPILDRILPSLLYVRMVSFFDEGLALYVDQHSLSMPKKKYKKDLNGRIDFLKDNNFVENAVECHRIRKKRNSIAHESSVDASWQEIKEDLLIIEGELRNLELIPDRPNLEFYATRSALRDSKDPNALFEQEYCFGLKESGRKRIEVSWIAKTMKS